ncbi:hypothetical protein [Photobacterium indicum]|uniref:hypothetical protein n=1 Tax=Photobacterium indicum TaxID=81447 RepID=UPI003D11C012
MKSVNLITLSEVCAITEHKEKLIKAWVKRGLFPKSVNGDLWDRELVKEAISLIYSDIKTRDLQGWVSVMNEKVEINE